jgi:hypothetical protein
MYENQFKAFKASSHFLWCSKEHWYKDKRDLTCDIFLPMLTKLNVKVILIMMDDRMIGWMAKSMKTGGMPKIIYEA